MRGSLKVLLALEVLMCFGPMTSMLAIGALLIPIQIIALIDEPLLWEGPFEVIGSVLCGLVGLGTLVFLLDKLLGTSGTATIKKPWLVLMGAIVGGIPLVPIVTSPILGWQIAGAMPILCGLHVLFLSRRMLFPAVRKP
jgi:hypothetical protein